MRPITPRCVVAFSMLASCALVLTSPSESSAQRRGDGAYGRLDGDLTLSIEAGGGFDVTTRAGLAQAELRARYLDSAGLFAAVDTRWRDGMSAAVSFGVDLRPLFLARFLQNASLPNRTLELLVGSIGLDLGAVVVPLGTGRAGVGLSIGTGVEVPLVASETRIFFLRLGLRYLRARVSDQLGPDTNVSAFELLVGFGYRDTLATGLVSLAPTPYRLP